LPFSELTGYWLDSDGAGPKSDASSPDSPSRCRVPAQTPVTFTQPASVGVGASPGDSGPQSTVKLTYHLTCPRGCTTYDPNGPCTVVPVSSESWNCQRVRPLVRKRRSAQDSGSEGNRKRPCGFLRKHSRACITDIFSGSRTPLTIGLEIL